MEGLSAEELKNQGNDALKAGDIQKAVDLYTQSIGKYISLPLKQGLDIERSEAVLTNRAVAYTKQRKFKEALRDCEQALVINAKFSKAYVRAYTCYVQLGEFNKASEAIELAVSLGDTTIAANRQWIAEYLKFDDFANKAIAKKQWHEARFYLKKIIESAQDSVIHTCKLLEVFVCESPNDMTDSVSYTTKV